MVPIYDRKTWFAESTKMPDVAHHTTGPTDGDKASNSRCNISGKCYRCCRCCQCDEISFSSVYVDGYYDVMDSCRCRCNDDCAGYKCTCVYADYYRDPVDTIIICGCSNCRSLRWSTYSIRPSTPLARVQYEIESWEASNGDLYLPRHAQENVPLW